MMRRSSCLAAVALTACRVSVCCAVALLTVASVVRAADTDHAIDISKADANGDGQGVKQAIHTNTDVHALFQKLDKDGDGFLSESELKSIDGVPLIRLRF